MSKVQLFRAINTCQELTVDDCEIDGYKLIPKVSTSIEEDLYEVSCGEDDATHVWVFRDQIIDLENGESVARTTDGEEVPLMFCMIRRMQVEDVMKTPLTN